MVKAPRRGSSARMDTAIKTKTRSTLGVALAFLALSFAAALASVMMQSNGKIAGIHFATTAPTYYVDTAAGKDTNNGTSASTAWKSLNKVSSTSMAAGSSVLFKCGQTWNGQLGMYQQVNYGTTCADTDNTPTIIDGTFAVTGFTSIGSNKYTATVNPQPAQVYFGSTLGTPNANATLTTSNSWYWAGGVLTVYSASGAPANIKVITTAINVYGVTSSATIKKLTCQNSIGCISINNSSNVTLDGVVVRNSAGFGGIVIGASAGTGKNIIIKNSIISGITSTPESLAAGNRGSGIFIWGQGNVGNTTISNNQIYNNGESGIAILDSSNNTVSGNTVYNNGDVGIGFGSTANTASFLPTGNIIERNTVYGNAAKTDDRFGINMFRVGNNNIIRYNIVHEQHNSLTDNSIPANSGYGGSKFGTGGIRFDGGDLSSSNGDYINSTGNQIYYNEIYGEIDGIQIFNFSGISIYNNTVVNSSRYGASIASYNKAGAGGTNVKLINTTVENNLFATAAQALIRTSQLDTSTAIDYNAYSPDSSSAFILDTATKSLSQWKSAGFDSHGIAVTNPQFVSASDYHIQNTSPVVNKGVTIAGLSMDADGTAVPQGVTPDIGFDEVIPPPDTTAPTLTLLGNTTITLNKDQVWTDPGYTATDDSDANPTVTVTGSVNTAVVGSYTLTYVAADSAGNQSAPLTRTVIVQCTENWSCDTNWGACTDGSQTRNCTDANNCGTTVNKPATTQTCTVATCTENWGCSNWGTCSGGTQTRTCTDGNSCGTTVNKPATTQTCTVACTESWTCGNWSTCTNSTQTRTCTDANSCGTTNLKPATSQSCTPVYNDAYCTNKYGSGYNYNSSKQKCCKSGFFGTQTCKAL